MSRPKNTKKLPQREPDTLEAVIVRAIFPPGFPVEIGYQIYQLRHLRQLRDALNAGRITRGDLMIYTDGIESHRITASEAIGEELAAQERDFHLRSLGSVLAGQSDFFDILARGVAAIDAFPKAKLAVADAWRFLVHYCGITPKPSQVAEHANKLSPELITASRARDYMRSMGMLQVGGN